MELLREKEMRENIEKQLTEEQKTKGIIISHILCIENWKKIDKNEFGLWLFSLIKHHCMTS